MKNISASWLLKAMSALMLIVIAISSVTYAGAHEKSDAAYTNTAYFEMEFDLEYKPQNTPFKITGAAFAKSYYDQLNTAEREIYYHHMDALRIIHDKNVDKIEFNMKTQIVLDDFPVACYNAFAAFDYDHPEYFWVTRAFRIGATYNTQNNMIVSGTFIRPSDGWYIPGYDTKSKLEKAESEFNAKVNEITKAANGDIYDKVLYFHDWLVNHNSYNQCVVDGNPEDAHDIAWTAASALIGDPSSVADDPVCEGYSRAFKVLCDKSNIPCVIAVGTAGGPHMWNYVKMHNGLWYAVDTTFDDPVANEPVLLYDHFLKGSHTFFKRHTEDGNFIGYGVFRYPNLCEYDYPTKLGGDLGDVTENGIVDAGDATIILRSVVGLYQMPDERRPYADFNCNGQVDSGDASLILRHIVENA